VKLWRLALRNALRNKVRTGLTVASIAVFLLTFLFLLTLVGSFESELDRWGKSLRVGVRGAGSLAELLPVRYGERLRAADMRDLGITRVNGMSWFGGLIPERERDFFANFAVQLDDDMRAMWDDAHIADEVWARWRADPAGAIAGEKLARRMGWEPGKTRITLRSAIYNLTLTVNLVGLYSGPDDASLFFNWKMLDEALGRPGLVGSYWVKVRSADLIPAVCAKIDDEVFKGAQVETKSETERAFNASFLSMMGNLTGALRVVGLVICFVLVLVSANTMAMAARERVREVAVLKTLGFRAQHVLALFLGEAVVVTGLGGLIGAGGAAVLFRAVDVTEKIGMVGAMVSSFRATPGAVATGLAMSVGIGLVAAGGPAVRAARLRIVDGLRRVV
jgi:putative ABC transport system permease protein